MRVTRQRWLALVLPAVLTSAVVPGASRAETVATIGGRAWDDLDRDGRQDGHEPGLAVAVTLLDQGGEVLATTTSTLPDGTYSLPVPAAGDHRVRFAMAANMRASRLDDPVVGDRYDSDIDVLGVTGLITVAASDIRHVDAGLVLKEMTGRLYLDRDASGRWGAGEPSIPDVTVDLVNGRKNPVVLDQTVTDEDGEFRVIIPPGSFTALRLHVHLPAGYIPAARNARIAGLDADGFTAELDADDGSEWWIGLYRPVRIGDRVWQDQDLDGRQDAGEGGVAGVGVSLWDPDLERIYAATVTNRRGRFTLVAPAPGVYRIVTSQPVGARRSPMRDDLPESLDSDVRKSGAERGRSLELTLQAGQDRTDFDIGMRVPR